MESDTDQATEGPEGSPKPMTKTLASASVLTLLMAGCGGKILYPHYYALDIPPAPRQAVSDTRMPATLAVRATTGPVWAVRRDAPPSAIDSAVTAINAGCTFRSPAGFTDCPTAFPQSRFPPRIPPPRQGPAHLETGTGRSDAEWCGGRG